MKLHLIFFFTNSSSLFKRSKEAGGGVVWKTSTEVYSYSLLGKSHNPVFTHCNCITDSDPKFRVNYEIFLSAYPLITRIPEELGFQDMFHWKFRETLPCSFKDFNSGISQRNSDLSVPHLDSPWAFIAQSLLSVFDWVNWKCVFLLFYSILFLTFALCSRGWL